MERVRDRDYGYYDGHYRNDGRRDNTSSRCDDGYRRRNDEGRDYGRRHDGKYCNDGRRDNGSCDDGRCDDGHHRNDGRRDYGRRDDDHHRNDEGRRRGDHNDEVLRMQDRLDEYRCDRSPAASTILGAGTVRQLARGGNVDPLQDLLPVPRDVARMIAKALVKYRFFGPNHGDPKKLVMKNNEINDYRVKEEYKQVVNNVPASIRWAKEHGKLNFEKVDSRLLDEVTQRPNLPQTVKTCVEALLREMAEHIQDGADSDDEHQ